jgi:hypothetical protein
MHLRNKGSGRWRCIRILAAFELAHVPGGVGVRSGKVGGWLTVDGAMHLFFVRGTQVLVSKRVVAFAFRFHDTWGLCLIIVVLGSRPVFFARSWLWSPSWEVRDRLGCALCERDLKGSSMTRAGRRWCARTPGYVKGGRWDCRWAVRR